MLETKRRVCPGPCGRDLEENIENFYWKQPKGRAPYFSKKCRACEAADSAASRKARWGTPEGKVAISGQNKAFRDKPESKATARKRNRSRYEADPAAVKARTKAYRSVPENRERRNKLWRNRGATEGPVRRASFKARYHADPEFRLRGSVRTRVWEAIRSAGGMKGGSVLGKLGYTLEELKFRLESQFLPGMSWAAGSFSIDHIVPQEMFSYSSMDDPDFRLCWSLHNLRPLPPSQNYGEGARRHLFGGHRTFRDLLDWIRARPLGSDFEELEDVLPALAASRVQDGRLPLSGRGLGLLDTLFTHRFRAKSRGLRSLSEAYGDDSFLLRVVAHIVKSGRPVTPHLVYRNSAYLCRLPSHFFPSAAAALVRELAPVGRVLDPFVGWGGRLLGASAGGAASYTGCDLSKESVDSASSLSSSAGLPACLETSDFRSFLSSMSSSSFDLVLTSPPFADSEDYGVGDVPGAGLWFGETAVPLARESARLLVPGGRLAVHCRDARSFPMRSLMKVAAESAGLSCERELSYGNRQSVLVFSRPWTSLPLVYDR